MHAHGAAPACAGVGARAQSSSELGNVTVKLGTAKYGHMTSYLLPGFKAAAKLSILHEMRVLRNALI